MQKNWLHQAEGLQNTTLQCRKKNRQETKTIDQLSQFSAQTLGIPRSLGIIYGHNGHPNGNHPFLSMAP